jgi:type IV pilus assembly protein PilB
MAAAPPTEPSDARPKGRRRYLGEMLQRQGVIGEEQLHEALAAQKTRKGGRLGRVLIELGYCTEVQICEVVAEQLQIPAADLVAVDITPTVLALVPRELAVKYACLPWFVEGKDLYLIMADPTNLDAADAVAFKTGLRVKPVVAPESEVQAALERLYTTEAEDATLAQFEGIDLQGQLETLGDTDEEKQEESEEVLSSGPVVTMVNAVLLDAIRAGASDIHIEPQEKAVFLRYRVDGMLRHVMKIPKKVQNKVISRIKIMAHMDIAERRVPQDGRTRIVTNGKVYDMRVSSLPTADGEKIVIRILVQSRASVALEDLGFEPDVLAAFKEVLTRPQGMILVTGPTGSGKTSTLYAALNFLKGETTNIVTVEDPIEYRLAGVNQVAVSDKAGLTFAAGLRSILRQDPNVIMVGEIRDLETAQVAFQASQTGHLVLSTLHTNDAPSAATRLVQMGIPAYLVASSVIAVQAQRLVRKLCDCRTLGPDGAASAQGCEACRYSGFRGRTAIYELMRMTPRVRSVLIAHGSDDVIRRAAQATGMRTMYADGRLKASRGITTEEEVLRVVPPDEKDDRPEAETEADGAPPAAVRVPAPLAAAASQTRRSRVLVVDDDDGLLSALSDLLTAENYDVVLARTGAEALNVVYQDPPHLILTDLLMPDTTGLELLRKLRGDLSTCQIPCLVLTAAGDVDSETQAIDAGADDYITKPVEGGRLLSRVRRALFRNHLRLMA